MAKKNIGATLSIKDNNFTAGIRNAITGVKNLKNHTTNATGGLKKMQSQSKLTGEGHLYGSDGHARCRYVCRFQYGMGKHRGKYVLVFR